MAQNISFSGQSFVYHDMYSDNYPYPGLSQALGQYSPHAFTDHKKMHSEGSDYDTQFYAEEHDMQVETYHDPRDFDMTRCSVCNQMANKIIENVSLCEVHTSEWSQMKNNPIDLGLKIQQARSGKRVYQSKLGELINIGAKTISRWEKGEVIPTIGNVKDIADALKLPLRQFFQQSLGDFGERCSVCNQVANKIIESVSLCDEHVSEWSQIKNNPKDLGLKIKQARSDAKLSLRKFIALTTNVDLNALHRLENGKVIPSLDDVREIAKALKLPMSHFFASKRQDPIKGELLEASKAKCDLCSQTACKIVDLLNLCNDHVEKAESLNLKIMGKKIFNARSAKQWSQIDLSQETGISENSIGLWENGRRRPLIPNLMKLAEVFGRPLDYFLEQ